MMYGCIAKKLGHSFSKDIHESLFDYSYELKEIPEEELDLFMKKKEFKAINVTIPYKEKVIPYLDYISEKAKAIGAVNTIVNDNGYLKGYNTDYAGMSLLINKNNIQLQGKKVLILGSGGTSKTALAVAKSMGCSFVTRVSREGKEDCITYGEAVKLHSDAQVIINTTPVGMYPNIGQAPICIEDYNSLEAVVDAVYNPLRSKLICDGRKRGIKATGGLYMLVAQAAYAAEKFIDVNVDESEIDRVYREIVLNKQNIVLTGMPGSGKTTIGKLLATEMGMTFIDCDEEIVKREGKSIPEIFSMSGEEGFRKIESEVINTLAGIQNAVIATGGGAILNQTNIDLLKENGKVYFIDRPLDDIVATEDRPLSSNRADLEKRYEERYPIYVSLCDKHIDARGDINTCLNMIKEDFRDENTCD